MNSLMCACVIPGARRQVTYPTVSLLFYRCQKQPPINHSMISDEWGSIDSDLLHIKQKGDYQCAFDKLRAVQVRGMDTSMRFYTSGSVHQERSAVLHARLIHRTAALSHFSVNKDIHSIFHIVFHSQKEKKKNSFSVHFNRAQNQEHVCKKVPL